MIITVSMLFINVEAWLDSKLLGATIS